MVLAARRRRRCSKGVVASAALVGSHGERGDALGHVGKALVLRLHTRVAMATLPCGAKVWLQTFERGS